MEVRGFNLILSDINVKLGTVVSYTLTNNVGVEHTNAMRLTPRKGLKT